MLQRQGEGEAAELVGTFWLFSWLFFPKSLCAYSFTLGVLGVS